MLEGLLALWGCPGLPASGTGERRGRAWGTGERGGRARGTGECKGRARGTGECRGSALSPQNVYAPEEDPELSVQRYERTFEQNEELGLNDMRTEGYEAEPASGR